MSESVTEKRARLVVERVTGLCLRRLDPGGGATALADYVIVHNDQTETPLEVTAAIDKRALDTAGARRKLVWSTPSLTKHWHISYGPELRVRALHDRREELFAQLELAGCDGLAVAEDPPQGLESVRQALLALGVRRVAAVGDAAPGGADISFGTAHTGSVAPEHVVRAVEFEAWNDGNREKLRPCGQLFVWIDSTMNDASAAMSFGLLPDGLDSPEELETVWVAPGPYADVDYLAKPVWRWKRHSGWYDLGTVREGHRPLV